MAVKDDNGTSIGPGEVDLYLYSRCDDTRRAYRRMIRLDEDYDDIVFSTIMWRAVVVSSGYYLLVVVVARHV